MQGVAHAVFIVAAFGFDGKGDGWFAPFYGREDHGERFVRESVARQGVVKLGYSADVAGVEFSNRNDGFAKRHTQMGKTLRGTAGCVEETGVGLDTA